jgi:hypothetical protein
VVWPWGLIGRDRECSRVRPAEARTALTAEAAKEMGEQLLSRVEMNPLWPSPASSCLA